MNGIFDDILGVEILFDNSAYILVIMKELIEILLYRIISI